MLDKFKYENKRGSTYLTEDNVYGAFIEEKTANDAEKGFYGVKKWYHANASPFEKNIATLIGINLISEREGNGKIRYKSSIDPIYSAIKARLDSSNLIFTDNEYAAAKIVIDSDWFRSLFSYQLINDSHDFECIRFYVRIEQNKSNISLTHKLSMPDKIHLEEPVNLGLCFMGAIGIVCPVLNDFMITQKFVPSITTDDIVQAGSFDRIMSETTLEKDSVELLLGNYCKYCREHCDAGDIVPNSKRPMIPDKLLKLLVSASPFLPGRISEIFVRVPRRTQSTLYGCFHGAAESVVREF